MTQDLRDAALFYHRYPTPGKLEISATKPLGNQRDLALAYSPGVAAACEVIVDDPAESMLFVPFESLDASELSKAEILLLRNKGRSAVTQALEAYAELLDFMETEYAPAARAASATARAPKC